MKKNNIRLLSVLLALILVVGVMPVAANAEEIPTSGTFGEDIVFHWNFENGVLTLGGLGAPEPMYERSAPWEALRTEITSVVIEEGIYHLHGFWFQDCVNLTRISLPSTLISFGGSIFSGCTSLTSVTIPANVECADAFAFQGCTNLREVIFQGNTMVGIGALDRSGLISITLPEANALVMEGLFSHCSSLRSVTLPETVTEIQHHAFDRCSTELTFQGDAPVIDENAFIDATITAYYPANKNWPDEVLQNYGGNVTWVPYRVTAAEPAIAGTYTTDIVFPAADLGISAPDSVIQATLTFGEDGKVTADWEALDLTALKIYFHDMFVNAYYAVAYGSGITNIDEIEAYCLESTGMAVSAYMDTIVTDEAMKAAFTPANTQGSYSYDPDQTVIYTDLALMGVQSDPFVPDTFIVENGTLYLNAASWGKPDYTFVCTAK